MELGYTRAHTLIRNFIERNAESIVAEDRWLHRRDLSSVNQDRSASPDPAVDGRWRDNRRLRDLSSSNLSNELSS